VIKPTESGAEITADYTRPLASGAKLEAGLAFDANKNDMDYRGAVLDSVKARWSDDVTRTNRFIYHDLIEAFYATWERSMGALGMLAGLRLEDSVINTNQATANLRDRTEYWRLHRRSHLTYQMTESGQLQLNYHHRVHRPETEDLNPFPQCRIRSTSGLVMRACGPRKPIRSRPDTSIAMTTPPTSPPSTCATRTTHSPPSPATSPPVTLLTTHENLARNRSGGMELVATTSVGATVTANASINLFRSEVDASNLGFSAATSATAASAKLNLSWKPAKPDTILLDASHSAKRLTAQGYRFASECHRPGLATRNGGQGARRFLHHFRSVQLD
jgi:hypothetical protein